MAIIQLTSSNPNLSFIIRKNPQSGITLRSIRKGLAHGWYTDDHTYNVYFRDADNEISYKQTRDEGFEYLNVSRYNTPLFPLSAISEFFATAAKQRDERDGESFEHQLMVNLVYVKFPKYIDFFNTHFPEFQVISEHQVHKSYTLKIKTNHSVFHLLHFSNILFLFLAITGQEFLDVSDEVIQKYIRSMTIVDAPYYIRYLFMRTVLNSKDQFFKYKGELERTERYRINFAYGNTSIQRRDRITQLLRFNKPIVDVGCGEGFYAMPYARKLDDLLYYAIDTNEEVLRKLQAKIEKKDVQNIIMLPSIQDFLENYEGEAADVILTEVVEHMPMDEARELIQTICSRVNFDHLIVTTPNYDFNAFYELEEFRHDDHQWEIGQQEFQNWIQDIFSNGSFEVEFLYIGDSVNGIYTTQGVRVTRKGAS